MDDQILNELKELRHLLSRIVGTSELPLEQKFSQEALDKAAKEFQTLSIERGEWVQDDDIRKIIKGAPYRPGKFIIENFEFKNYFKRGSKHYFNKKDLQALSTELKERNINLEVYIELIEDQEKFKKYLERVPKSKKEPFKIPKGLKNVQKTPRPLPSVETIKSHIATLKENFKKEKLSEYIDLYQSKTHAMFKHEYYFDRYMDPIKKKRCRKWCEDFNHANEALKRVKAQLKVNGSATDKK